MARVNRFLLWPRSLAARTALVLLLGLGVVQIAGLTIHALDRIDVQRLAQARDAAVRIISMYRTVALASRERARRRGGEFDLRAGANAWIADAPIAEPMPPMDAAAQRQFRGAHAAGADPGAAAPARVRAARRRRCGSASPSACACQTANG